MIWDGGCHQVSQTLSTPRLCDLATLCDLYDHSPSLPLFLKRTTYNNNNNNIYIQKGTGGGVLGKRGPTQTHKVAKVRTPRATTPHPCRICAQPVAADSPETALHPTCKLDTPKCSRCGREPAIPNPNCTACAGTGNIAASACPWCPPAPGPSCVVGAIIASVRLRREQHEHIGDCARCGYLSALPLGPLCANCTIADDRDRHIFEMVG